MPAYYTVVQYIPDPIRGERLNIGVLVYGDGRVRHRFLQTWNRAKNFGEEDIKFLHDFARSAAGLTEEKVAEIVSSWDGSIQLTKPAGSLLSPDELLLDTANRYLRDYIPTVRLLRNRQQAIKLTRSTVRQAVADLLGSKGKGLVKDNLPLSGPRGDHEFDVGAQNGRPYFAARAMSFEAFKRSNLLRQIESTEFAIEDVHQEDKELPLAVIVFPPKTGNDEELYQRAITNFKALNAQVIEEKELSGWANRMASLLKTDSWQA